MTALAASRPNPARGAAGVTSYLLVEDVARMLGVSRRVVHELTRTRAIPHRKLPNVRRCLFDPDELVTWIDAGGAALEVIETRAGGRVVRPVVGEER